MKQKWYLRYIQVGWLLLLGAALLVQFITPAGATSKTRTQQEVAERTRSAVQRNGARAGLVSGPSRLKIVRTPNSRRTIATRLVAA